MNFTAQSDQHTSPFCLRVCGNHRGIQQVARAVRILLVGITLCSGKNHRFVPAHGQIHQIGGFFQCCGAMRDHCTRHGVILQDLAQGIAQAERCCSVHQRAVDIRMFNNANIRDVHQFRHCRDQVLRQGGRYMTSQTRIKSGGDGAAGADDADYGFTHVSSLNLP